MAVVFAVHPANSLKTSHRLSSLKDFPSRPPMSSQVGTTPTCTLHPVTCTLSSMRPSQPERAEFLRLARSHSPVPLYRTLTADLETPVSAFLRLAAAEPECFLLESVEGGEHLGRYTYIRIRPSRRIVSLGDQIEITEHGRTRQITGDVFALLRDA